MTRVATKSPGDVAADKAVSFINGLKHTKGKWAGVPFTLPVWQEKIVRDIFGTLRPDGLRQYRTAYVEIPRKNGKALALDTPLPTPDGWTTMGAVRVGDELFSETGQRCRVLATTEVMYGRPCYEVVFSDGCSIVADEAHEWLTTARVDCPGGRSRKGIKHRQSRITRVRTTKEIVQTLHFGTRGDRNHSVSLAGPLRLPDANLPVDPYVLGAWLGDGNSRGARITCGYEDAQILKEIEHAGIVVREYASSNVNSGDYLLGSGGRTQAARNVSLQATLRRQNLLRNKHIPDAYLRASVRQRLALLQGLMDTDGYVSSVGECEFTTTSSALAQGVLELVRSLGFKPSLRTGRATLYGKDCGEKYRIMFFADSGIPVFRLDRKSERQRAVHSAARSRTRQIVSVEQVASVPVRCIEVDSPSHLYLAGEAMIPTHNSELAAAIANKLLFADGEYGAEIYGAAHDRDQASLVFNVAAQMVRQSPVLRKRCKIIDSQKRIVIHDRSSFYRAIPADAAGSHGFNGSGIVFDEFHTQKTRDLYDVLTTSTGAREQPLIFIITTAGYDRNSVCWELHDYATQVLSGAVDDPSFYACIYSAPEDADWKDEEVWKACNPALGDFRSLDEMRQFARRAEQIPALENTFRNLYLNQWTQQRSRWISLDLWDENAGVVDENALKGRACYGGLDLAAVKDLTAWVMVFPRDGDPDEIDVICRFWCPEARLTDSENRYRSQYQEWARRGFLLTTPGESIDYGFVKAHILEDAAKFRLVDLNVDRLFQAHQLSSELEAEGLTVFGMGQGFMSMAAPMSEFQRRLLQRKVHHGGHPVLRWMADNAAVRQDPAGSLKFDKAESQGRIDGLVALVEALDRVMRHEEKQVVWRSA